jgi:hypothetical protein
MLNVNTKNSRRSMFRRIISGFLTRSSDGSGGGSAVKGEEKNFPLVAK